jgi:hypothetical protein
LEIIVVSCGPWSGRRKSRQPYWWGWDQQFHPKTGAHGRVASISGSGIYPYGYNRECSKEELMSLFSILVILALAFVVVALFKIVRLLKLISERTELLVDKGNDLEKITSALEGVEQAVKDVEEHLEAMTQLREKQTDPDWALHQIAIQNATKQVVEEELSKLPPNLADAFRKIEGK